MFGGAQRKLKLLFGLSDLVLSALAFSIAYALRRWLPLTHVFFFTVEQTALLFGFSAASCIFGGYALNVYGKGIQKAAYDSQAAAGDPESPRWGLTGFYASVIQPGLLRPNDPITLLV